MSARKLNKPGWYRYQVPGSQRWHVRWFARPFRFRRRATSDAAGPFGTLHEAVAGTGGRWRVVIGGDP